jgi:hypothetical protein
MTSFWVIGGATCAAHERSEGDVYRARAGINTGLEGVYRVEIVGQPDKGKALVRNVVERAKIPVPVVTRTIEDSLLLPYVTGASLGRWRYDVAGYYVVPHTAEQGMTPISESEMKRTYRLTYDFFALFEDALGSRTIHQRWGKDNPFYSMYNIGPYTFTRYRVAWKRSTKSFAAVVLGSTNDRFLGNRLVVPNGKVMIVPFEEQAPAYYLCGLLNSSPARWRINQSITTEAHAEIIKVVPLDKFSRKNAVHCLVADLAEKCHAAAERADWDSLAGLEEKLDDAVAELWGIPGVELKAIREGLNDKGARRCLRNRTAFADEEDVE